MVAQIENNLKVFLNHANNAVDQAVPDSEYREEQEEDLLPQRLGDTKKEVFK
jgi:hypothetical protein